MCPRFVERSWEQTEWQESWGSGYEWQVGAFAPLCTVAYRVLYERGAVFTATDIKELFQGSMQTQITFLERYDRMVKDMEQKVGIEIKATTMSSYHTVRKHLQVFIGEKYHTADIPFGQMEEDFLECLQHYSVGKLGHSQGH